ncbi:HERV-H LTR-associating protein 2 isoform X5 [Gallus gallus]|uniref:HHLA2 member of B7 family n=1 Tax=Gallus gallus TaxID=9031 RepID=A0A8V0XKP2_CHICK|nr:HERV-H LTR-associating protein 2 isoform X5 [Gallus gallus]XP_046770695.1 HERV-H LTR-associating protein 2 isoform X5 [Gallus gallus]
MKGQKIPSLFHLLSICATFWGSREEETITGLFSKDVILPCPFSPGNDEVIHWNKENKNVHSYYKQKDQLKDQHPDYRNRTHLFLQNIALGNASLKLSNVTLSDEGLYQCYVGTEKAKTEVDVMLQVQDQLSKAEGSSTAISCEHSNIALHAEDLTVVWRLNKNAAISVLASFNGTFQIYQPRVQINQQNFSLSISDLNVDDSGDYVCNISTPHYTRLTVTTLQVEHAGNTKTVVTVIVIVIISILIIVVYCLCKKISFQRAPKYSNNLTTASIQSRGIHKENLSQGITTGQKLQYFKSTEN